MGLCFALHHEGGAASPLGLGQDDLHFAVCLGAPAAGLLFTPLPSGGRAIFSRSDRIRSKIRPGPPLRGSQPS